MRILILDRMHLPDAQNWKVWKHLACRFASTRQYLKTAAACAVLRLEIWEKHRPSLQECLRVVMNFLKLRFLITMHRRSVSTAVWDSSSTITGRRKKSPNGCGSMCRRALRKTISKSGVICMRAITISGMIPLIRTCGLIFSGTT